MIATFGCKYELTRPFSHWRHRWSVVGARMAIELHIEVPPKGAESVMREYSGGLEVHYRAPPSYMRDQSPLEKCHLLGGPCWADGSSLQASEIWIPRWKRSPNDHEAMFAALERELIKRDGRYEGHEDDD